MKRQIIIVLALMGAMLTTHTASAQVRVGGATMNRDVMMAWDFAELSRTQTFGTSRAMGMGGAFTSLGADMTSMTLNPAGLGMYRGNEFSITPLVSLGRAETANTQEWAGNSANQFAMSNVGAVMNVFQSGSRTVSSLTVGFGINRIADFNTRTSFSYESRFDPASGKPVSSIADAFAQQLQFSYKDGPILPDKAEDGSPNGHLAYRDPYFWPAVMAYKSAMIHLNSAGNRWGRDAIGHNASILRSMDAINSGSINEFEISVGANIQNIVYFGATIGIQNVHKTTDFVYGEDYGYFNNEDGRARNAAGNLLPAQLDYADLWQRTVLDGVGASLKLGIIVRPVAGLRLGVAFHTPTYYSLDRSYMGGMDYLLQSHQEQTADEGRVESPAQYDEAGNSWDFISPSRLMLGASYTFGRFAIVSVDYERDWYNGIRVKNTPGGIAFSKEDYKMDMKENFCATNALRAGIELRPMPSLAVRLGGGYTTSMLKDEELAYEIPQTTTSHYFTAGLGVNFSRNVTLDAAYQNLTENQSSYRLFYSEAPAYDGISPTSELFSSKLTRHFITLTLGVRF